MKNNLNLILGPLFFLSMAGLISFAFPVNSVNPIVVIDKSQEPGSCGAVTDIDGNVYQTVRIGEQCWIKSNLRVKHYLNGDPISEIRDPEEWENSTIGAWCYYDNDPGNEEKYGLLYNWYALNDPRGLSPAGWKVPTMCDYTYLPTYWVGKLPMINSVIRMVGFSMPTFLSLQTPVDLVLLDRAEECMANFSP